MKDIKTLLIDMLEKGYYQTVEKLCKDRSNTEHDIEGDGPLYPHKSYSFFIVFKATNIEQIEVDITKYYIDITSEPNTPNTCLLYTSPSPRDS